MANKNPWQRTVTPEVTKQPLLEGKTFRVDIENWGIPRDATASDVVRFEETELGNKYDLSVSLLKELENYSHNDVVWVTKKSIDAEYYLSEGMTKKDISEVTLPKGSRIIAEDGQGGYLVLRGDAKPEVAIPEAEVTPVTPEVTPETKWTKTDEGYETEGFGIRFRIIPRKGAWQLDQRTPYVDRLGVFDTLAQAKARVEHMLAKVVAKAKPPTVTPVTPEVTPTPSSTNFIATLLVIGLPLAILYLVLRRDDEPA